MNILPSTTIEETLYSILPWTQKQHSGMSEEKLLQCENDLNVKLPNQLRTLYSIAGLDVTTMTAFNIFRSPEKLIIEGDKLIFLEENQGACSWSVELGTQNPKVYMQWAKESEWIAEDITLDQFISLMLYNQCIQMGYKYCGIIGLPGDELYDILEGEWEKVVDYNGLHVYKQHGALIWSIEFGDEEEIENDIFFSTYSDELYYLNEVRYNLVEI